MRFDELLLKIPGDELRIRFHENLTVLTGIGLLERQALADSILGAVTGKAEDATLTYTDGAGRRVALRASGGRVSCTDEADGSPVAPLLGMIAKDEDDLRALMLLQAGDLGLTASALRGDEPPELSEARATLEQLTEQLRGAMTARQSLDSLQQERHRIDKAIRQAQDGAARREYARVLAQLERVRAEANALQSGGDGVDADRHLLASADDARALGTLWTEATVRLAEVAGPFGDVERLDEHLLATARHIADEPPRDLDVQLHALSRAAEEHTELEVRLHQLAESKLPEPSHHVVVELARADQDALWTAHRRILETSQRFGQAQVSLGGIGGQDGPAPRIVAALESAHTELELAEGMVERRFVPGIAGTATGAAAALIALSASPIFVVPALAAGLASAISALVNPRLRLARAQRQEQRALAGASAPSYLAFHIRRVEATVDPDVREQLDLAALEHRLATTAWADVAGDVDPATATPLEAEVRAYDDALHSLGGAADEIEALRRDLAERAVPELDRARGQVLELTRTYGLADDVIDLTDNATVARQVHHQLALGRTARLQDELEAAEADEQKLAARLDDLLHQLGFSEGTLEARVGALDWAVGRANDREEARVLARSRDEVEQDLVHLQEEARRLRRPEWATVTAADAEEPDLDHLQRRRQEVTAALSETSPEVDVEHLADRHSAMERRIAALESRYDGLSSTGSPGALADLHQYLLAHLTKAAHAGPQDEAVPVVLDDIFLRIPAERKWDLLDMLRRLGEKTQLMYLTDDPFVAAWARRRAAAGEITLLEPVAEPV